MNPATRRLLSTARALRGAAPSQPVPSPCVSVCRMDAASGLCEGCLRTLDEIAAWGGLAEPDRRAVWARIEQRATRSSDQETP
jgi:predicted Fe-S protein YdhL (DUF1289 family)